MAQTQVTSANKQAKRKPVEIEPEEEQEEEQAFELDLDTLPQMGFVNVQIGNEKRAFAYVKPSQCVFTDIPELNRKREGWTVDKVAGLKESVRRRGYKTACVGWMDGKTIVIGRGSQRLKVGQELEAEGLDTLRLPVNFVKKPTTQEEIAALLLDSLEDNTYRYSDDWMTKVQTFQTLRDTFGLSDVAIGQATGFSHTLVNQHLKAVDVAEKVPAIAKALQEEVIMPREAALLTTAQYRKGNTKDGELDLDAVKQGFSEALEAAEASGSSVIRQAHLPPKPSANPHSPEGGGIGTSLGVPWLKKIQEACAISAEKPQADVDVPRDIQLFISLFRGQVQPKALLTRLHKQGDESFDWLIEFEAWIKSQEKAKAKAKDARETAKAKKAAEAEEEPEEEKPAPKKPATPSQKAKQPRRNVMVEIEE